MRLSILLAALALPTPLLGHSGHLADLAGHDHWVAGAAAGIAIGLSAWAHLKGRRSRSENKDTAQEPSAGGDEAPAGGDEAPA
ncbi:DUF6732 family protein [Profundibacterium mesophilum]|uniref:Uncharacterized protein n=1 Tax=Profundibacterium mesophilum KAUST100406-0324 TaxID=1037889 RepID=A0A921NU16_9RHOB|nr:DUF6732 family protein [Profundibacterium mesophilum]KAF0675520.1 hypothetical protein PMES_02151 [Profundibacterium mesophilum KAUST100406-0324]